MDPLVVWGKLHSFVRKRRISVAAIALLLFLPSLSLLFTDSRFAVWIAPFAGSTVPSDSIRISADPDSPIFPGTSITVYIENYSQVPQEDVIVYVEDGNGTILHQSNTNTQGITSFVYPGEPVIVYAVRDEQESRKIIVGEVPVGWAIAQGLLLPGLLFLLLLVVALTKRSRDFQDDLEEVRFELEDYRSRVLASKSMNELRSIAKTKIEAASESSSSIPDNVSSEQVTRDLLVFLRLNQLEEHLLFGLVVGDVEGSGDARLDKKLSIFALTQTLEENLAKLGQLSSNEYISKKFLESKQLTSRYMLKVLYDDADLQTMLDDFGRFDRSDAVSDFDLKLDILLNNTDKILETSEVRTISQFNLDLTIALLARNFTHHISNLESILYQNKAFFQNTQRSILRGIISTYSTLNPAYFS